LYERVCVSVACCNMLQCVAVCCSRAALQTTQTLTSRPMSVACVWLCESVRISRILQCVAVCCSVLQPSRSSNATHFNVTSYVGELCREVSDARISRMLQRVAACCSVLHPNSSVNNTHFNVTSCVSRVLGCVRVCKSVACRVCCRVLQSVAVC